MGQPQHNGWTYPHSWVGVAERLKGRSIRVLGGGGWYNSDGCFVRIMCIGNHC